MVELPHEIKDYGVTRDGQWLYAATDYVLYTIDLNTFQAVSAFVPTNVNPSHATLHRVGVVSSTLVYVSTNPGYASGGPIYQWNPQTNEWLPSVFCDSAADSGSRAELRVSADYTTIGGLCDPRASPTTAFLYRLGDTVVDTWGNDIRIDAAISSDGQWLLSSLYPHGCTNLLANHYGEPNERYISTSVCGTTVGSPAFGSGVVAYASNPSERAITEVTAMGGFQIRYLTITPHHLPAADINGIGGLVKRGNWLYVALRDNRDGYYDGEILAVYVDPFDTSPPSSQVINLPAFSDKTFPVLWSGTDIGEAGLHSFDVQYRDGPEGDWTDWLLNTTQEIANFTGEYGHTYYFRCRARDHVGNLEDYPTGDSDASTRVYRYALPGHILDNREQPVFAALVQSNPPALNTALSDGVGNFTLYFDQAGISDATVIRHGFGTLPPTKGVPITGTHMTLKCYLPPTDDHVTDGGFEAGDLAAWTILGEITPTLTATAHSGDFGVALGGPVSPTLPNKGNWSSVIKQEIVLSPALISPTLSLLYKVVETEPMSDTLQVSLVGTTQMVTYTLPLTIDGWTHQWWDLAAWGSSTVTLQIEWHQSEKTRTDGAVLDEISLGSAAKGVYSIHLPLTLRNGP